MVEIIHRDIADEYITPHFKYGEHFCKCGKCLNQLLHPDLYIKLEYLRREIGNHPLKITSGYRCKRHNEAVGGAPRSKHMEGIAADIACSARSPRTVALEAKELGFTGIKVYRSWLHVDLRLTGVWHVGI